MEKPEFLAKLELSGITRLELSRLMDLPYTSLANKINGYSGWVEGEQERALEILNGLIEAKEAK